MKSVTGLAKAIALVCCFFFFSTTPVNAWLGSKITSSTSLEAKLQQSSELLRKKKQQGGRDGMIQTLLARYVATTALVVATFSFGSGLLLPAAGALDMDAFALQQLATPSQTEPNSVMTTSTSSSSSSSSSRIMSEDEALCRFGQPSLAKGDACVRAGLPTAPLKKGGVDAFGQVDRGNFKRCKKTFEMVNGQWQDEWICQ